MLYVIPWTRICSVLARVALTTAGSQNRMLMLNAPDVLPADALTGCTKSVHPAGVVADALVSVARPSARTSAVASMLRAAMLEAQREDRVL